MGIPENLIHELLDLSRQYVNVPYNSIFMFVAYDDKRTLDFFDDNIYSVMVHGKREYGPKIESLLLDIRDVLVKAS